MVTLSGCATKKFVRQQIATLDTKVTAVDAKTKENAERIDAVDRRATQGITAAATADTKATQAGAAAAAAATSATNAQRTADTANQGVQAAGTRITNVENRFNTIDTYTAGPVQSVTFKTNSTALSDADKSTLDGIAGQVSNLTSGYAIEIEGFTDGQGGESFNNGLSDRRADAVMRYLVSKNVALHRITIVGLGKSNPVGDNKTKAGREQNRRVEVKVLRSQMGRTGGN
jgi:outer membrane protein OmpA-like peptidoglycan-associated protein